MRQMLKRVRITEPGDTDFLLGEHIERWKFEEENERVKKNRKEDGRGRATAPWYHQGVLEYGELHLSGIFPGDHQGSDGSCGSGQDRPSARSQRERDYGSLDSCGTGLEHYRVVRLVVTEEEKPAEASEAIPAAAAEVAGSAFPKQALSRKPV